MHLVVPILASILLMRYSASYLVSNVVDVRDPIQIAYDQLAKRAEAMLV
jgi:hypothetical protein